MQIPQSAMSEEYPRNSRPSGCGTNSKRTWSQFSSDASERMGDSSQHISLYPESRIKRNLPSSTHNLEAETLWETSSTTESHLLASGLGILPDAWEGSITTSIYESAGLLQSDSQLSKSKLSKSDPQRMTSFTSDDTLSSIEEQMTDCSFDKRDEDIDIHISSQQTPNGTTPDSSPKPNTCFGMV
jgi:hypothetical protein